MLDRAAQATADAPDELPPVDDVDVHALNGHHFILLEGARGGFPRKELFLQDTPIGQSGDGGISSYNGVLESQESRVRRKKREWVSVKVSPLHSSDEDAETFSSDRSLRSLDAFCQTQETAQTAWLDCIVSVKFVPNVYRDEMSNQNYLVLVTEHEGISLSDVVHDDPRYEMPEFEDLDGRAEWTRRIQDIFRRLLSALVLLHNADTDQGRFLAYRHLSPSSLVLARTAENSTKFKLMVLDLAKVSTSKAAGSDNKDVSKYCVTSLGKDRRYSPAEATELDRELSRREYQGWDLFSAGCILYFLATGGEHLFDVDDSGEEVLKPHFSEDNEPRVDPVMEERLDELESNLRENVPEASTVVDLIRKLIALKPEDRTWAIAALHHPFFWGVEDKSKFVNAFLSTFVGGGGTLKDDTMKQRVFDCVRHHQETCLEKKWWEHLSDLSQDETYFPKGREVDWSRQNWKQTGGKKRPTDYPSDRLEERTMGGVAEDVLPVVTFCLFLRNMEAHAEELRSTTPSRKDPLYLGPGLSEATSLRILLHEWAFPWLTVAFANLIEENACYNVIVRGELKLPDSDSSALRGVLQERSTPLPVDDMADLDAEISYAVHQGRWRFYLHLRQCQAGGRGGEGEGGQGEGGDKEGAEGGKAAGGGGDAST